MNFTKHNNYFCALAYFISCTRVSISSFVNILNFLSGVAVASWNKNQNCDQLEKLGINFSSFNPCPSLPSISTDDRRQFQCLNIVLNNKPGPLFMKCYILLFKNNGWGEGWGEEWGEQWGGVRLIWEEWLNRGFTVTVRKKIHNSNYFSEKWIENQSTRNWTRISTLYTSLNRQHMNGAARIQMHQSQPTIMIKIEQCYYTTSLC